MFQTIKHILWLCVLPFVISCGGGGGGSGASVGSASSARFSVNAPEAVTLEVGQSVRYQITGGKGPYRVKSSAPNVALGVIDGSTLIIGGVARGVDSAGDVLTSLVTVTEDGGAFSESTVTVVFSTIPLSLGVESVVMAPGSKRVISINGGAPGYTATSSNDQIVSVVSPVSGQQLTLTVPATASGDATVRVVDKNGQSKNLTVNVSFAVQPLALGMSSLTIPVELPGGARVKISGGLPPYRVSGVPAAMDAKIVRMTNTDVVTSEEADTAYYVVQITPKLLTDPEKGLDVAITDSANQTEKVNVIITGGSTGIRISPSALTLAGDFAEPVLLSVFGAVGDIRAFSTDSVKAAVTVDQLTKTVNVTLAASTFDVAGKTCAAHPASVLITVVDANTSVSTAALTFVSPVKIYTAAVAATPTTVAVPASCD